MQETTDALYAARPYAERLIRQVVTIRRARALSQPGHVSRRIGDRVAADTMVAETNVRQGYRLIEIDKTLGARFARPRRARKVILKRIGDVVERGEAIARAGLLRKTEVTSPVAGQIVDIRDARVLIEAAPQNVALIALYPGQVVELIPDRGVVIETTGTLVQGTWGWGNALRTTLAAAVPGHDVPLLVGQITGEHVGMVVLAGRTIDADVIAQAVEHRVRGLIAGSMRAELAPVVRASELSVILTEGFGNIPMHPRAFELLNACAGQEVCVQPSTGLDWKTQRPEVFCFAPGQERPALAAYSTTLSIGARVRVLRAPYEYAEGEIVSLPWHPRRLASGITAWGAEVKLEATPVDLGSMGTVFVPVQNLQVIR